VIIEARFFLSVFEDSPRWLCTREIQTGFTTAFGSKVPSKMASRSRDLISGFDRSFAKLQAKRPILALPDGRVECRARKKARRLAGPLADEVCR
jgi:hypothetical protein